MENETPRAYTKEEVREQFLRYMWDLVQYWEQHAETPRDALEGLMHSTLVMLDGHAMAMPGFVVMPFPHESDEEYCKQNGENWYPDDVDIAGNLHDLMYRYRPGR